MKVGYGALGQVYLDNLPSNLLEQELKFTSSSRSNSRRRCCRCCCRRWRGDVGEKMEEKGAATKERQNGDRDGIQKLCTTFQRVESLIKEQGGDANFE